MNNVTFESNVIVPQIPIVGNLISSAILKATYHRIENAHRKNNSFAIEHFLEGMSINARDAFNESLLTLALYRSDLKMVKLLIENGADFRCECALDGMTHFEHAFTLGSMEIFLYLLEKKIDPNVKFTSGSTALIISCQENNLELVSSLLKHQANPNIEDRLGNASLFYACKKGNREIVRLLVQSGANVYKKGPKGKSLLFSIEEQWGSVADLLGSEENSKMMKE